ncbi:hypothetical protein [Dickeya chrysanthemi]|uniref:hypothetical protein n=1 Tax=Dickeya chrysanthemi TaxID=556 RepID=UPI0012686B06|nr:hypothetical protein [Dickeya chrysanthemi]
MSKLLGVHSVAALQGSNEPCPKGPTRCVVQNAARFVLQLELFWVYPSPVFLFSRRLSNVLIPFSQTGAASQNDKYANNYEFIEKKKICEFFISKT